MSKSVKSYFESHSHRYSNKPDFYSSIVREIRSTLPKQEHMSFLDIGCGDGSFVKALLENGIVANYVATDLSLKMVMNASLNLDSRDVALFVADAFHLPLDNTVKFDIIHLDSVLHHLIDITRGQSTKLVEMLVSKLMARLAENGILIVQEYYYDSYVIHEFTSFLVFYGLKLLNLLHLDLSFTKEIRRGLEVNFLHERKLKKILSNYGHVTLLSREVVEVPRTYQVFLLRERGHITFSTKKIRNKKM